jgi:hypothetical protein
MGVVPISMPCEPVMWATLLPLQQQWIARLATAI